MLDAAFALEHTDFLAVLSEMLMVRHLEEPHQKHRFIPELVDADFAYDDPHEDDIFDAPPATPSASRRASARKR